jgi:hypothetical protein
MIRGSKGHRIIRRSRERQRALKRGVIGALMPLTGRKSEISGIAKGSCGFRKAPFNSGAAWRLIPQGSRVHCDVIYRRVSMRETHKVLMRSCDVAQPLSFGIDPRGSSSEQKSAQHGEPECLGPGY